MKDYTVLSMPWYDCPHCGTLVISAGALAGPEQIRERCTKCHADEPLTFLDLLGAEFEGYRVVMDELFENGERLHGLYTAIEATGLHAEAQIHCEFERGHAPSRAGIVLGYIAQAIRNAGEKLVNSFAGQYPNVVVVATLCLVDREPTFVVGMNGHGKTWEYAEMMASVVPPTIAGCRVVVVTDQLQPHERAIQKRLREINDLSAWSWHGEQKILRHIKTAFGVTARCTATCIGIAHVAGPCHTGSAGTGTNYCYDYLHAKYLKDQGQIDIGGLATHGLAAYWYQHKEASWNATVVELPS